MTDPTTRAQQGPSHHWQRRLAVGAQIVAIGAAILFLARTAQDNLPALSRVRLQPSWGHVAAASLLAYGAFASHVLLWTQSLGWWGERASFRAALRVFVLTNVARYVPGTIWQFAGLAALSRSEGISPLVAAGAVLFQQFTILATGLLLGLALGPRLLATRLQLTPSPAAAPLAGLVLALFVMLLPRAMPALGRLAARAFRRPLAWPSPTLLACASYTGSFVGAWLIYGVAFFVFGRALFGVTAPPLPLAVAAYVSSYVVGILAVFAPAGLFVREAALVAALSGTLGPDRALVLAVASRLWLVSLEILAALFVVGRSKGERGLRTEVGASG